MGAARPIAGWGEQGYQEEKARRVDAGQAPPVLLSFQHAHHEWLDMWAKHGLIGLLTLMAAYAVPGLIYTRVLLHHRTLPPQAQKAHVNRQLCAVCGLLLVVGYLGFGMTQVMFAHNSSSIMYVFMNLLWLGAMLAPIEATPPPTRPQPFGRPLTLPPRSGLGHPTGVRAGWRGCGLLISADGCGASLW
jgi:O-antigen ligase